MSENDIERCLQLFDAKKYQDAINCIDPIINQDPKNKKLLYLKGAALYNIDELDQALKYFNMALDIDPNYVDALNDKGVILLSFKEYEEAKKCFNKIITLEPNFNFGWYNMGIALFNLENFSEALKYFKKAIMIDQNFSPSWYFKGLSLEAMDQYEKAVTCFDKALSINSEDIDAIYYKGISLRALKSFKHALKCFKKIISIDPENVDAWYQKGNVLRDLKREKESLIAYNTLVELVEKNDITEWKLTAKRIKEYIRLQKEGTEVILPPPKKPQFWQWVTKSEYFLESDGTERKDLDPFYDSDPGGYWTCHKDTRIGDLILLYRAGKKNGITYQDIKYLIQAQSDAYTIDYDEYAFEHGWQYGCDYKPLFKFENSINYHELKEDPYLEDWNALRGRFQGIVFRTEERHWKRLQDLFVEKNPEYKEFLKSFKPKEVIDICSSEKELEDKLSKNISALKKFGYDLKLTGRQVRCLGQGGRIDLLCEDKKDGSIVIIELKIVKATRNTFGQISNYIGWAIKRKANGKNVKGIVISKGYDNEFDSAKITNENINHIELVDVFDELGMKLK